MTYEACLEYLYQQLPMYQRIGNAAFKKSLHNILALSEALGNPHQQFRSIHIGGTNGKGSSSNMLAAILQQAGYRTGLYTSPHLKSFTERIRLNGEELPKHFLTDFVEKHQNLFEQVKPSFFEMTVALAFQYFAEEAVDVAIIEVGLGGRLDSTNIISPVASLITNIGLDHQALLGDTLEAIAAEKAGIIKPLVPCVVSQSQPQVAEVFVKQAKQLAAPLFFADQEYLVSHKSTNTFYQVFDVYRNDTMFLPDLQLDLLGHYQAHNLPGVLKVVDCLRDHHFEIEESHIRAGLQQVKKLTNFKGRWQVLQEKPLMICDTGHNEDGIRQIISQLHTLSFRELHFVFGAVNDKDVTAVLELLPQEYNYYFCQANIPRALPVEVLLQKASRIGLKGSQYTSVSAAVAAAKAAAQADDVIFIGGSTFVVAEVEEL